MRPGVDAAGDVGDARVALGAQIFGDAQAATAVVAVDEQMFFAREGRRADLLGDLSHGDELGALDLGGLVFEGLAHVDKQRVVRAGGEEVAGFLDGDFQRDAGGIGGGGSGHDRGKCG